MKKILYVVLDGVGDLPIKELGDKTPLEAAVTPNMDRLAQSGKTGIVYTVGKGIAPESDIAVISLLGYDAHKYYTGRGPLESFAEGLAVNDGDVAFRVNFAIRLALSRMLSHRAGARLQTLVIDEGFGNQDAEGRLRLVEAINLVRHDFEKILINLEFNQ